MFAGAPRIRFSSASVSGIRCPLTASLPLAASPLAPLSASWWASSCAAAAAFAATCCSRASSASAGRAAPPPPPPPMWWSRRPQCKHGGSPPSSKPRKPRSSCKPRRSSCRKRSPRTCKGPSIKRFQRWGRGGGKESDMRVIIISKQAKTGEGGNNTNKNQGADGREKLQTYR